MEPLSLLLFIMVNVLNGIQQLLIQPMLEPRVIAGAPTASRHVLVSPVDRHLIFFRN